VKKLILSGVVLVALAASGRAHCADLPMTGPAPAYPNVAPICYGGDIVRANNQVSASESRILEDDIIDGAFA
jgi:hypothetical protein